MTADIDLTSGFDNNVYPILLFIPFLIYLYKSSLFLFF